MKSFNINDYVYVELNSAGWEWVRKGAYKSFEGNQKLIDMYMSTLKSNTKLYKIDGVRKKLTKFQLHNLMSTFGPHFCGCESPFSYATMYIDNKDLTEVSITEEEPQGE